MEQERDDRCFAMAGIPAGAGFGLFHRSSGFAGVRLSVGGWYWLWLGGRNELGKTKERRESCGIRGTMLQNSRQSINYLEPKLTACGHRCMVIGIRFPDLWGTIRGS
jgi:hypothetical protein